jgi:hypothetical protein
MELVSSTLERFTYHTFQQLGRKLVQALIGQDYTREHVVH